MVVKSDRITIHTDCLFDPKTKAFAPNKSIIVDTATGLIVKCYERTQLGGDLPPLSDKDIDLRGRCVLPGLVDAHTHIFLHPETPSINQERDESVVERVIRATHHCRTALLAGYTTYRDLGTEGLRDADVHVRDAINRGLTPGPRIFCVTETLASSGGYAIRQENEGGGTVVPRLSDPCDGEVGVRAAVRRRLGAGADLIKFYADYRKRTLRFPPSAWPGCPEIQFPPPVRGTRNDRNPNRLQFTQSEMDAIVAEARASRAAVAAHAQSPEAMIMAARAGVTTVEHGFESWGEAAEEVVRALRQHGCIFVPTLAMVEQGYPIAPVLAQVVEAHRQGVKLACGGDTGDFAHGDNVRELELMLEAGVPLEEVLTAATLHGWEACGGDWCGRRFGWWDEGCAADIIALDGDVRKDVGALRRVEFVMKDAKVWKKDGHSIGMG